MKQKIGFLPFFLLCFLLPMFSQIQIEDGDLVTLSVPSNTSYDYSIDFPHVLRPEYDDQKVILDNQEERTIYLNEVPSFTLSETNLFICLGSSSNAVRITSEAVPNAVYTWSSTVGVSGDAQNGWVFNPSESRTYILRASANNLTSTQEVIVEVSDLKYKEIITTFLKCNNVSTGKIAIEMTGGTPPYTYAWDTTPIQTGPTATNLAAGVYTVVVTDAKGCTYTIRSTVPEPPALSVVANQTDVICRGTSTGTATIDVHGGTAPYTYAWDTTPIQTGQTATNLVAGVYTVVVTDAKGCTTTENFTINEPPALSVVANQTDVMCRGTSTGTATVDVHGGTAPYTYAWDTTPIQTEQTATDLATGVYTVVVTDAKGCTTTENFTINEPPALSVAANQTDVMCYGTLTGTATVDVRGGTPPYTYAWDTNPIQTDKTAVNLVAGSYTVTITDQNGCTIDQKFTITEPTALNVTPSQTNIKCQGASTGTAAVTVTGGTPPYTYAWDNGATTASIDQIGAGTYTVTITDKNGCTIDQKFTIIEPTALSVVPSQTNIKCQGASTGTAAVTVTGGTPPYTYAWDNGATTASIDQLRAGTYTVTITDKNGCTIDQKFTITEPTALSVVPSQTNIKCQGASTGIAAVTVTGGTPPYTYAWDNGATTASIDQIGAGTYTVTITDKNGCTTTEKFTITEPAKVALPEVQATVVYTYGDLAIPLTATALSGNTLQWYTSATGGTATTSAPTPSTTAVGTQQYWVSQRTATGCESDRQPIEVQIKKAPLQVVVNSGQNKVYGSLDGVLSYTATGFKATDTATVFTGALVRQAGENVGTYLITQGSLQAGPNYEIILETAHFTITPAPLTVHPNPGQTKVYGSANPIYSYSVSGFVSGDTAAVITGLLDRQIGESVGLYSYQVGTLATVHHNYAFTIAAENFSITPATITVQANAGQSKTYGTKDPAFTYTVTGLVNGDTKAVFSGSLQRVVGEDVGLYAIEQGSLQPNSNYQLIQFTGSEFQIVKAKITGLQFKDKTVVYDGTVHSLVVGGNSIAGALITYTGNNQVNVGTYPITARIDYGSNYEILELKATLRITPAEQHLVFEVASPLVLEDTPPFALNAVASSGLAVTYTYAYIENEPATISTTGQVILFTPGIVEITAHQSGNNNYKAATSITRRLVIHSKDSSIWTLEVDGESFEKPSKNTLVVRGCEKAAGDVVEIKVATQLGTTVLPSAIILVQTPEYGTYKQDIEIVAEDGIHRETYTVIIEKRMPWEGVLLQKYDNLVFVNNNPATNGGYTFSKYEWYKNGQKVAEKQVFSEGPTSSDQLDPAAEYYAVLYTTKGKVFVTCPMQVTRKNTYSMAVYPNPVGKNTPLTIRFDYPVEAFKTSEYTIYNTIGQFITKGKLEHAVSVIDLPFDVAAGTYILVLKVDGAYKSVRFVVK